MDFLSSTGFWQHDSRWNQILARNLAVESWLEEKDVLLCPSWA